MYSPKAFTVENTAEAFAFIEQNSFATLITEKGGELTASHLPLLLSRDRTKLYGHMARENTQHMELETSKPLVVFQGAHGYVSPTWYNNPGVPTWNYQAVHVYGRCNLLSEHKDLAWIIEALTKKYEAIMPDPWSMQYPTTALNAIIGFEILIEKMICKFKLSQNRSAEDVKSVMNALQSRGEHALCDAMQNAFAGRED